MKRKINTNIVKDLLLKSGSTQKELASSIGLQAPSLSYALKGDRQIPMDYIFAIANFFEVEPISLTVSNDTKKQNKNATTNQNTKVAS